MARREANYAPQNLRNNTEVRSLGLLFPSYVSDLEMNYISSPELPTGADTERLSKSPFSLARRSEETVSQGKKLKQYSIQPNTTEKKNCGPMPTHISKGQVESLDIHLCKAVTRHPNILIRMVSEKAKQGTRRLFLLADSQPPLPRCLWGSRVTWTPTLIWQ